MSTAPTQTKAADVVVELLYLDMERCEPCRDAGDNLDDAIESIAEALAEGGRTLEVRRIHVTDPEQAETLGLTSSPTIRVNGVDIAPEVREAACPTCSAIAKEPVACRTFLHEGREHPAPPSKMIVEAALRAIAGAPEAAPPHPPSSWPSGVAGFLEARARQDAVAVLRERIRGEVLTAGDGGWDAARGAYNTLVDQRPAVLVLPEDAQDVVTVVEFARAHGMRVVPQRTGHNAEPLGSIEGAILLRTDRMRGVEIDPVLRRARVGGGAKWEDVVPAASELGLAAPHGSTADVGIVGYALGGGVGWYGRKHGLAANSVTGIEIVTADGRLRWVDADHEPELFWALRGGGGANFGVVTALEVQLYEMPEVYAGILFFPLERSGEVLHAWHAWTAGVPDEMTSVWRIAHFPPLHWIPQELQGRSFTMVEAFHAGPEAEGTRVLAPLRALGPVIDTVAVRPPSDLAEMHMDPPEPLPHAIGHRVLGTLTAEAVDAVVAAVGPGSGSALDAVEIRHLGGAFGRAEPGHGVLARMPGEYILLGIGVTPDDEAAASVRESLDRMTASVAPVASGMYFNFTDQPTDPAVFYGEETYRRLRAVRAAVDPDGLFRANHSIPLDGAG